MIHLKSPSRKPDLCISSINHKIGMVKKLRPVGGSLSLILPDEWIRRFPQLKWSDAKVLIQIDKEGFLRVMPYMNEAIILKEYLS